LPVKTSGFAKIRAGLAEHLLSGRLSVFDAGVYLIIQFQANFSTGVWIGSAPRLLAAAPRSATLRQMQKSLEHLRKIGFLRTFRTPGKRGNYRCLIHKYEPQSGALRGWRLNAEKSTSWKHPIYDRCTEADTEHDTEPAPIQDKELKPRPRQEAKPGAKKPRRGGDPRFVSFLHFARSVYRAKHRRPPNWTKPDEMRLGSLLGRNGELTLEQLCSAFANYLASTDPFYEKACGDLGYFCAHVDRFFDGPIIGRKEKLDADDTDAANVNDSGLDRNGKLVLPN
jgi:hypothetical protein